MKNVHLRDILLCSEEARRGHAGRPRESAGHRAVIWILLFTPSMRRRINGRPHQDVVAGHLRRRPQSAARDEEVWGG
jgi:hypothetical protein